MAQIEAYVLICTALHSSAPPFSLPPPPNPNVTTATSPSNRLSTTHLQNPNLLNNITKLLWGKSLPPQLLISTVQSTWSTTWHLMMSQLAPSDPTGGYTRPTSPFRANPNSPPLQFSRQKPNTLHLYVGLPCTWAHRALIVRALKGLEDSVPSRLPRREWTDLGNSRIPLSLTRIGLFRVWIVQMGVKL